MAEATRKETPKKYVYRSEFVSELSWRTGLSLEEAAKVTDTFLDIVQDRMKDHQAVTFDNFGTFDVHETTERMGRNPMTMEEHVIPAGYKPVFRPSRYLKDNVSTSIHEGLPLIPKQSLIRNPSKDGHKKKGRPKKVAPPPTGYRNWKVPEESEKPEEKGAEG